MTYRELLEQYKDGVLDEAKRSEIAADIEKHDAISEYLCENGDIPVLDTLDAEPLNADVQQKSSDFTALIRTSIRKAFIKAGVIVGTISVCTALGVVFGLPKLVDQFYYDPNEGIGKDNVSTQRFQLDLTVYSELFLPRQYCLDASADGEGYGEYNITVYQTQSWSGYFPKASGVIKRNKLKMYDPGFFDYSPFNGFAMREIGVDSFVAMGQGAAGSAEDAFADLKTLDASNYYHAQLTLDRVYTYEEYAAWCAENEVFPHWTALCYWNEDNKGYTTGSDLIGFRTFSNSIDVQFDDESYPYLTKFSLSEMENGTGLASADIMKQHVLSMLRYTQDAPTFYEMMQEQTPDSLQYWEASIEKNGLFIYGFTVTAQKEELERLAALDAITYIHTDPTV